MKLYVIISTIMLTVNSYGINISQYNVKWTSQSKNSSESMPCGGGSIGLNVWVENNELLFYMSRSGAFDENNIFPKFGRVRLCFTPNIFEGADFSQELILRDGHVSIAAQKGDKRTVVDLWVDVFRPVIHADVKSDVPVSIRASYESWRTEDLVWNDPGQTKASIAYRGAPFKATVFADTIQFNGDRVEWYHRNREKTIFDATVEQQSLEPIKSKLWNPLSHLTFGGYMKGNNMEQVEVVSGRYASTPFKAWVLQSKKSGKNHSIELGLHIAKTSTLDEWFAGLQKIENDALHTAKTSRQLSQKWWNQFWDRSYIALNPLSEDPSDKVWQVGRNYQLFRYQLGCNAYGDYPTKFNGGLFTFDPEYVDKNSPYTPDHRDWGGGAHTQQNQRLVYFMMNKSGDYDMLPSQIDFYVRALGNAEARTEFYWGHKGACFTEQLEQFGLPMAASYNWRRAPWVHPGLQDNPWLEYEWDTQLEFCLMALDMYHFHGQDIKRYVPLVESCLDFFYEHYQWEAKQRSGRIWDGNGKLIIYPGSGCETFKLAYNPSNTIAALMRVSEKLLSLPEEYLSKERREYWEKFQERIPPIPLKHIDGKQVISPAETWARINNHELPQLYPIFPWGIYGVGMPDLETARNTWNFGKIIEEECDFVSWHQEGIWCARLGMTELAADYLLKKMADAPRRFPTFWGPGHDWVPDHNWGGSGMINLQEMVMQTPANDSIYILPSVPSNWDVDFRLSAPRQTVVEVSYRNGKIDQLNVTPESRRKDIVINPKLK